MTITTFATLHVKLCIFISRLTFTVLTDCREKQQKNCKLHTGETDRQTDGDRDRENMTRQYTAAA